MSLCALNFGYDVGTFSGVQAMQPFGRRFGKFNEETNKYSLPGWLSSVMTATPFLGKAMVCDLQQLTTTLHLSPFGGFVGAMGWTNIDIFRVASAVVGLQRNGAVVRLS